MNGPWYEQSGPSAEEVRDDIRESFWKKEKNFNCIVIDNCIDRIIPKTRNGFGSWRGYRCFKIKENLMDQIKLLYDDVMHKIAKFLDKYWIQDRLYRPPTETQSAGLRYYTVKTHFTQTCNECKPTQSHPVI